MVIAKILMLLKQRRNEIPKALGLDGEATRNYSIDNVVGIHIDYANRPESEQEADFVQDWCQSAQNFVGSEGMVIFIT